MVGGGISHPLKQMILDERNRIEFHVACGLKIPRIAELLGRNPTSIREEILKHRLASNKHYGYSNRLCARFDECTRTIFNGFKDRIRKNTPKCFESCPDFREASCPRLSRSPFVCNGCEQERECPMKNLFNGHAKSTVYGWIANGLFSVNRSADARLTMYLSTYRKSVCCENRRFRRQRSPTPIPIVTNPYLTCVYFRNVRLLLDVAHPEKFNSFHPFALDLVDRSVGRGVIDSDVIDIARIVRKSIRILSFAALIERVFGGLVVLEFKNVDALLGF